MRFIKMDACGNDYIYVEASELAATVGAADAIGGIALMDLDATNQSAYAGADASVDFSMLARKWSDRHHGIGADGLVLIGESDIADAKMRMFNADGSEGSMCGNAIRCVGWLLHERTSRKKLTVETRSGVRELEIQEPKAGQALTRNGGLVTVDMGAAKLRPSEIPVCLPGDRVVARCVKIGGAEFTITCVSVGNPHCVILVPDVETVDVSGIGSAIENGTELFPDRVNVEFVEVVDSRTLRMRVWERGSGETLSCGTGACAAVTAAVLQGLCREGEEITIQLRGGELLVRYTKDAIFMTGPCTKVYAGEVFLKAY